MAVPCWRIALISLVVITLLPGTEGGLDKQAFVCVSLHPGIGRGSDTDDLDHRETFEARGLGFGMSVRGIFDTCGDDQTVGWYVMPGFGLYASRSLRSDEHSIAELNLILSAGGGVIVRHGPVDCLFAGPEIGLGGTLVFDHDRILDRYRATNDGGLYRFGLLAGCVQDWSGTPLLLWAGYEWRYTGVDFGADGEHSLHKANYLSRGFTVGAGLGF